MSLTERLSTPPAPKPRKGKIDLWLDTLTKEDREAVLTAAVNTAWRHSDLLRVLIEEGMPVVADVTLGDWRRRQGYDTR